MTSAPQPTADAKIYRAFISYSHAADRKLAPALQRGLRRLAQPWYRLPAFRVFRDEATLTATPHLWPDIEQALADSTFFILMAFPAAAASLCVDQEVAWWLVHKPRHRLLIALTEGDLAWDAAVGVFDWSVIPKALPPSLHGAFAQEPRWEDLRWARTAERVSLRDPRFRSCVAGLAAPMRGAAKDELIDEDVRQSRRAVHWRRTAIAMLVLLTFLAGSSSVQFWRQRNTAQQRQKVAVARQMLAQADMARDSDPRTALLLGIAANHIHVDGETQAGLLKTLLTATRYAGTPTGHTDWVGAVALAPDGRTLATSSSNDKAEGQAVLWDLTEPNDLRGHAPKRACGLTGRGLNRDEWAHYLNCQKLGFGKDPMSEPFSSLVFEMRIALARLRLL